MGLRPGFNVKQKERRCAGDQQAIRVHPTRSTDAFVKGPFERRIANPAQQSFAQDVKPEQLLAFRMPERPLAQLTNPVIKNLAHIRVTPS